MQLKEGHYTAVLGAGNHLTFHIEFKKHGHLKGKTIIGFFNGYNNESNYEYFGFVNGKFVNMWSKFRDAAPPAQLERLRAAISVLTSDPDAAGRTYALKSGLCYRCNSILTNPESIQNGIGPVCSRK